MSSTTWVSDPAFWAGYHGNGDTPWDNGNNGTSWQDSTYFYVTNKGELHAKDAYITGTVNATNGTIGGWKINNTSISSNNGNTYVASSGGYAFYSSGQNGTFKVGFYGDLYCDSANITGKINATSGTVAGWDIQSNAIDKTFTYEGNTYRTSIQASTNLSTAAFVVQKNGANQFYVTYGGKLMAKNADITGTINATSGSFTGTVKSSSVLSTGLNIGLWKITENGIYGSSPEGNVFIEPTRLLVGEGYGGGAISWYLIYSVAKAWKDGQIVTRDVE